VSLSSPRRCSRKISRSSVAPYRKAGNLPERGTRGPGADVADPCPPVSALSQRASSLLSLARWPGPRRPPRRRAGPGGACRRFFSRGGEASAQGSSFSVKRLSSSWAMHYDGMYSSAGGTGGRRRRRHGAAGGGGEEASAASSFPSSSPFVVEPIRDPDLPLLDEALVDEAPPAGAAACADRDFLHRGLREGQRDVRAPGRVARRRPGAWGCAGTPSPRGAGRGFLQMINISVVARGGRASSLNYHTRCGSSSRAHQPARTHLPTTPRSPRG
jgi:hypothetical protein